MNNGLTLETGYRTMKKIQFNDGTIFILAEIAQSYEGKIEVLLELVDGLADAGDDQQDRNQYQRDAGKPHQIIHIGGSTGHRLIDKNDGGSP